MYQRILVTVALVLMSCLLPGCYMIMGISSNMQQNVVRWESDHYWDGYRDQRTLVFNKSAYVMRNEYEGKMPFLVFPGEQQRAWDGHDWTVPEFDEYHATPEGWPLIEFVLPAGSVVEVKTITTSNNITHTRIDVIAEVLTGMHAGQFITLNEVSKRMQVETDGNSHFTMHPDPVYLSPVKEDNSEMIRP